MLITRNPTSNTTPDAGQGGVAVTGAINTGHGSTTASVVGAGLQTKSCIWSGFAAVGGQIASVTLKVDFSQDGTLSDGGAATSNQLRVQYSTNGGGAWTSLRDISDIVALTTGTDSVALSASQDLTQVQVRDRLIADSVAGQSASVTATISQIRLEVQTADVVVVSGGM